MSSKNSQLALTTAISIGVVAATYFTYKWWSKPKKVDGKL